MAKDKPDLTNIFAKTDQGKKEPEKDLVESRGVGLRASEWAIIDELAKRTGLDYRVDYTRARIGAFDVDLLREFFQGFVNAANVTLHVDNLKGINAHHQAETVFKAFGRALRMAVTPDPRMQGRLPSTKEKL